MMKEKPLRQVCGTLTKTIDPSKYPEEVFSYFSIPAFDTRNKPILTPGREIQSNKILLSQPCVLFSRLNPRIRRVWELKSLSQNHRSLASTEFVPFTISEPTLLDPRYLYWFLFTEHFLGAARAGVQAATKSRERVKKNALFDVWVPLPPIGEQKRIAGILDKADRLRRLRRYALELSEGFLQSVFLEMFGDPVTNPMGWVKMPIGHLAKVQGGYAFKSQDYVLKGIKLVKISNVHHHSLKWDDIDRLPENYLTSYSSFALDKGDIVISLTRPIIQSLDTVKVARVNNGDLPCLLNQRVGRFLVIKTDTLHVTFLLHFLYTQAFKQKIEEYSAVMLQPNVSTKQVEEIEIIMPPFALQEKFARAMKRFDYLVLQQREAIRQADHLFNTLLHRAFRGEL